MPELNRIKVAGRFATVESEIKILINELEDAGCPVSAETLRAGLACVESSERLTLRNGNAVQQRSRH